MNENDLMKKENLKKMALKNMKEDEYLLLFFNNLFYKL
jgi:hypothetical protein